MKISLLYLSLLLTRKKFQSEAEREKLQSIRHQTQSHLTEQMQEGTEYCILTSAILFTTFFLQKNIHKTKMNLSIKKLMNLII